MRGVGRKEGNEEKYKKHGENVIARGSNSSSFASRNESAPIRSTRKIKKPLSFIQRKQNVCAFFFKYGTTAGNRINTTRTFLPFHFWYVNENFHFFFFLSLCFSSINFKRADCVFRFHRWTSDQCLVY